MRDILVNSRRDQDRHDRIAAELAGTRGVPWERIRTVYHGVEAPADQQLYATYRAGRFRYDIPLRNGSYRVTLGFVEPLAATTVGERVFDVLANGTKVIADRPL